jgi:hypothetical protein
VTVIVVGITIILRKKSEGILHESDNSIIIAATTDIKAKPIEVAIPADLLLCIRAKTEDIEEESISMPPTMATAI